MLRQPQIWILAMLGALAALATNAFLSQDDLFKYSKDLPEILHLVDQAYVDEVNMESLMPGVFQGALERVDENASYIPPGIKPEPLQAQLFKRTGLTLTKRNGYAHVLAVAPKSPAETAGIKPGAYIQTIGGKSTHTMSLFETRKTLSEKTESVQLVLIEPHKRDETKVTLTPGSFEVSKIQHLAYDDGIHVIRIGHFYDGMEKEMKKLLNGVKGDNVRVMLDLRNNSQGSSSDLLALASLFLPQGKLASWVDAAKKTVDIVNPKSGKFADRPLFILLDQSTAHAAEEFGAIVQDQKAATVIGRSSLGFPARYQMIPLKSGGFVELSTHLFRLKSGKILTREGVKPDLELEPPDKEESGDPLLQQALEAIRKPELRKAS